MVSEKIVAVDFKKLKLKDFEILQSIVKTQKQFEKQTHAVSRDGTMFINKRFKDWETVKSVSEELAKSSRCELELAKKFLKDSKKQNEILLSSMIDVEIERRNLEQKYYNS